MNMKEETEYENNTHTFKIEATPKVAIKFIDRFFKPAVSVLPLLYCDSEAERSIVFEHLKKVSEIIDGNFFESFWDTSELRQEEGQEETFAFKYVSRRGESSVLFTGTTLQVKFSDLSNICMTRAEFAEEFKNKIGEDVKFIL